MKIKKILSTALSVVLILSALIAVFPVSTYAAHSSTSAAGAPGITSEYEEAYLNSEELAVYLKEYLEYNFTTAYEMLDYELRRGLLYSFNSQGGDFTMFVNKYTGFVYYMNNYTGQVLTSNPINPGYTDASGRIVIQEAYRRDPMSQIIVNFSEITTGNEFTYTSYEWAAQRSQISVAPILGGFRVAYTLGDTTARFLLPGIIKAADYEEYILKPMISLYVSYLEENCREEYPETNFDFFGNEDYIDYEYGVVNLSSSSKTPGLRKYLTTTAKYFKFLEKSEPALYNQLNTLNTKLQQILIAYTQQVPAKYADNPIYEDTLQKMYDTYPVTEDGTAIYVYSASSLNETKRGYSDIIKKYCPDYTFAMMYEDEKECGYVDNSTQKPVIRCALEYTFNEDGSLSVRLPASSITFDETVYNLKSVTPLKYFGSADMSNSGYIFYPDGSGTIIDFADFYSESSSSTIALTLPNNRVYGKDFCYSKIDGAHREQITMPVFGLVTESKATLLTEALHEVENVTNGFFAILEEGSALANLSIESGGGKHRFATVYALYEPYPYDTYDASGNLSVGSSSTYTMVADSKYTGSYVTRYVMLNDETVGELVYGEGAFYESSYVGMASYYRNYLKANGTLEALELVSEDLPLYIETLGSMEILKRILSFPVTVDIPLTTFGDIITMYEELSKCEEYIKIKADEFDALADAEEDENQKHQYKKKAESYRALIGQVDNIKNINFKLTGFANGGMYFTYPVKAKWEKACGGKSGLNDLLAASSDASAVEGQNFGVYPEFDFMYINNTSAFDGIKNKGNVARMIDNRYASKQEYNSIFQAYESFFTMVISSGSLDKLYSKFQKKISKFDLSTLSVSTLGSDINSNFDEKDPINREQSISYITALLSRMTEEDGYELMMDKGNVFSVKYATHILNAATDSSHFRYSSYAIPFTGMVLHSYVNYTGTPINYSGSPDYDILRSIENGASLYYILCYQNTSFMKDDQKLSKYYGVDYINWYADLLTTYKTLNDAIGDLQGYEIVDHEIIIAERIIEAHEAEQNKITLRNEIIEIIDAAIAAKLDAEFDSLRGDAANYDKRVKLVVDRAAVLNKVSACLNQTVEELDTGDFKEKLDAVIAKYSAEYPGDDENGNSYVVNFTDFDYESKYSYVTDSFAQDKDYVYTDFTSDDGNVTLVTYKKGDHEVKFILNYNIYSIDVKLDGENTYTIESHGFARIG